MRRGAPLAAAAAFVMAVAAAGEGRAVQPDEILADKRLEARARTISAEVRCLVCQNQSIDDSDASLAHDLRVLVRERLQAGDSDGAVRDFIVSRYGPFVLLRPPVGLSTLVLWFAPGALLAGAVGWLALSRRRRPARPEPFSPDEETRIAAILAGGPPKA